MQEEGGEGWGVAVTLSVLSTAAPATPRGHPTLAPSQQLGDAAVVATVAAHGTAAEQAPATPQQSHGGAAAAPRHGATNPSSNPRRPEAQEPGAPPFTTHLQLRLHAVCVTFVDDAEEEQQQQAAAVVAGEASDEHGGCQ